MPRKRPSKEAVVLHSLRFATGWNQKELARELGFAAEKLLSRYEKADKGLSREHLGKLLAPLGLPVEAPDVLLWALDLILPEPSLADADDPLALTAGEQARLHRTVLSAAWSLAEGLRAGLEAEKRGQKLAAIQRRAKDLATRLSSASVQDRGELLRLFPEFRSWAVAAELAHGSVRAASHKVPEALRLAEMAVEVARRVRGAARRARTEGYCLAFLANALRVATRYEEADGTMAKAWVLWRQGTAALPLAEWRLLDLEGSLRREQHRFAEALSRLDEALTLCEAGDLALGRLLLNKANVQQQAGDHTGALSTLSEALPPVVGSQDAHLLFALRFNVAVNLCLLERFPEAEARIPEVRELAIEQGKELDLLRLDWLQAKVFAGQGRSRQAIAELQKVCRSFTARELPYEAALAFLDVALLLLQEAHTHEVRRLTTAMAWVFEAKGIAREALAALSLFCEAARNDAATVDLVKRVIEDVARSHPSATR